MKKEKNELLEWIKVIAITTLFVVAIRTFIFTPIDVKGASMMPTYEDGDRIIVNKIGKTLHDFERFDVIVFDGLESEYFIKRIIGLPGDQIEYKDDVLYINGQKVDEPYLDEYKSSLNDPGDLTPDFTLEDLAGVSEIPNDYYFVMGDNRRKSSDSRDPRIGLVSKEHILGSASIRFYPLDSLGLVK
ncbi:signal peptidase I [Solibacillus sp. FSL K6-1781]|uniref:signal peptidase I n=1 Tax=Solibacillus sp. FSL K6-1781 TaxID=2921474 RepID=UPI00315B1AB3